MLGITEEMEKKHPKLVVGISGAVVLSILIMGGQLTYQWGVVIERQRVADQTDREIMTELANVRSEAQRGREQLVRRDEYVANNEALLRELQAINRRLEVITQRGEN